MLVSEEGIQFIKKMEGLSLKAYNCIAGKKTIGYGCVVPKDYPEEITIEEAEKLFLEKLSQAEKIVNDAIKHSESKYLQHEFDMLTSFIFNVGYFSQNLMNYIIKGDKAKILDTMLLYVHITKDGKKIKSQGLKNRRGEEMRIFMRGYHLSFNVCYF